MNQDLEAQLGLPVSSACNKGLSGDKAYIPMKLGARVGGGGTAAPVRHQGHARGEAEVFLARRAQETKQRRALFNAETDAEEI